MGDLTENFSRKELACKHCGQMHIPMEFVQKLQRLRDVCGFPFIINSGYRCPQYNDQVSNTGRNGPHTKGAVDIRIYGYRAYELIKHATSTVPFNGIGVSQKGAQSSRFVHIDDLPEEPGQPRPWVWSY